MATDDGLGRHGQIFSAALLEHAQRLRTPSYPAFATAYLFSEWAPNAELVSIPFDVGVGQSRTTLDLDLDQWLDLIQCNVVDFEPYMTVINNESPDLPAFFACISGPHEPAEPLNPCIEIQLGLEFHGRVLVFALDTTRSIVPMLQCYRRDVDLVLSRTSTVSKSIFMGFLGARVRAAVARFIPVPSLASFFTLLRNTDSLIAGSVATFVYCCNVAFAGVDLPSDLNILVPKGQFGRWQAWMDANGTTRSATAQKMHRFDATVSRFGAFICGAALDIRITVSESRTNTALYPLFASELTSQMTVVTARRVLAYYPALTSDLVAVVGWMRSKDRSCDKVPFRYKGMLVHHSTVSLGKPCGDACGFIWHRTIDAAVNATSWGVFNGSDTVCPDVLTTAMRP
ncbi:hypothetical protein B0H15DRAFT_942898 [Mycena belliarum]|uniref:Uncharacterized protein n=1 Tax=Mycena belliarum TaxID=1033014 RepID=A0AAD6UKQ0_9AGAR|nr:hypothetical protein B0H15DRAFT_942898 [Mycena belliae]